MVDRVESWITGSTAPGQPTGHRARPRDYVSLGLTSVGGEHLKGGNVPEIQALARQLEAEFSREIVIAGRLVSPITSGRKGPGQEVSAKGKKIPHMDKFTSCRRILNAMESDTRSFSQRKPPSRGATVDYLA